VGSGSRDTIHGVLMGENHLRLLLVTYRVTVTINGTKARLGWLIVSFADKRTAAIFAGYAPRKGISSRLAAETLARMQQLHAATALTDLRTPPGNRLESLKGNRRGQFSIRVDRQWRLCFRWENNHAHDVELVDYHD
jgi:toxin HigB-1